MGQPFSAPNGDNGQDNDNPYLTTPPTPTNTPYIGECDESLFLKDLLIKNINYQKNGYNIIKETESIKTELDRKIKHLEEEHQNMNVNYTIKETDFKILNKKVQNLNYIVFILRTILVFLVFILIIFVFVY